MSWSGQNMLMRINSGQDIVERKTTALPESLAATIASPCPIAATVQTAATASGSSAVTMPSVLFSTYISPVWVVDQPLAHAAVGRK